MIEGRLHRRPLIFIFLFLPFMVQYKLVVISTGQ